MTKENSNILQNNEKCDSMLDRKAISILNHILTEGHSAEVFVGKYGVVIREIKRKLVYDQSRKQ